VCVCVCVCVCVFVCVCECVCVCYVCVCACVCMSGAVCVDRTCVGEYLQVRVECRMKYSKTRKAVLKCPMWINASL